MQGRHIIQLGVIALVEEFGTLQTTYQQLSLLPQTVSSSAVYAPYLDDNRV